MSGELPSGVRSEPLCYFNGRIRPLREAYLSVHDIGMLRGYGLVESLPTSNRKPFMLQEHLDRLRNSANELDLVIPASNQQIQEAINDLISHNVREGAEGTVRIVLTGGEAIGSLDYRRNAPTFYITVEECSPLETRYYTHGASLMTSEYRRANAAFRAIGSLQTVRLQRDRLKRGAIDILYIYDGSVYEAATSNFFIVRRAKIVTPKDDILHGITRRMVIDFAKKGHTVEERPVTLWEALEADEAFITGSFHGVVPIVKIDDHMIGSGVVGETTRTIMDFYHEARKSA